MREFGTAVALILFLLLSVSSCLLRPIDMNDYCKNRNWGACHNYHEKQS